MRRRSVGLLALLAMVVALAFSFDSSQVTAGEPAVVVERTQVATPDFVTVSQAWALAPADDGFVIAGVAADPDDDEAMSGVVRHLDSGGLDPGFGDGGVVRVQGSAPGRFGSTARGVVVDREGRIVLAGPAADEEGHAVIGLQRLTADGSLDPTFGVQGRLRVQAAAPTAAVGESEANDLALDPEGRLVVVGMAASPDGGREFVVLRLLESGELDPSFADGGIARVQPDLRDGGIGSSWAAAVALDRDGRIIVAGRAASSDTTTSAAVVVLTEEGKLDGDFAGDGTLVVELSEPGAQFSTSYFSDVAILEDGRLALVGEGYDAEGRALQAVAMLADSGSADGGFGDRGIARMQIADTSGPERPASSAASVGVVEDRIYVAGTATDAEGHAHFTLTKLDSTGAVDGSFGRNGTIWTQAAADESVLQLSRAADLLVGPDRRMVVAGTASTDTPQNPLNDRAFAVALYSMESESGG